MKGYKAVKKDSKGFYTDGMGQGKKTYWKNGDVKKVDGKPKLCANGFHFFEHLCFAIKYFDDETAGYFEIEASGEIEQDTFKCCATEIKIIRKITEKEIERLDRSYNSGYSNSGYMNSGNCNSGYMNSGYMNSGNYNSGNYNTGGGNSGSYNSGSYNSGGRNSGNYNSGNYNTGGGNSGYMNSGNYNSGYRNSGNCNSGNGYVNYFCTETKYFLFDVEVSEIPESIKCLHMGWFDLAGKTYKEAWAECPDEVLNVLRAIPEFQTETNKAKFKDITGIDL